MPTKRVLLAALVAAQLLFINSDAAAQVKLVDVTEAAGVTFRHVASPEKRYIVESMSGGVALFDYDNDGRLDIYFVDSLTVETANDPQQAGRLALMRADLESWMKEQGDRGTVFNRPGNRVGGAGTVSFGL